jgi:hypothetical protein
MVVLQQPYSSQHVQLEVATLSGKRPRVIQPGNSMNAPDSVIPLSQMTPAETKRGGKPALHHHDKKPITGHNAHEAHDYE